MRKTSTRHDQTGRTAPRILPPLRCSKCGVWLLVGATLLMGSAFHPPAEPAMTVVIDAGHGGSDPGNLGTGRYKTVEKDVTLAVALKTAAYIQERIPSVRIILTREGDTYPDLPKRVRIANDNNADLLMSIHCDSFAKSTAHGSATFVMGLEKSEASLRVAQNENAALFAEGGKEALGFDPDDPDTFIALALRQEIYLDRSLQLASLIQGQFRDRVGRKDRGVRQADYYVTAYANMPSVLVELGFLTNPTEEDFLLSEQGQDYMASALFRAFRDYATQWFDLEASVQRETPAPKEEAPSTTEAGKQNATPGAVGRDEPATTPATPAWFSMVPDVCDAEICFTVQAASSRLDRPLLCAEGMPIPHVQSESVRGVHKYRVGSSPSYAVACRLRDTLQLNGFPDAFVVAFKGEVRISLEEAIRSQRN